MAICCRLSPLPYLWGWASQFVGPKAENFKKGMEGFAEVMYTIIGGIMKLAPYAVFCLIIPVEASQGISVLAPLGMLFWRCILPASSMPCWSIPLR